MQVVMIAGLGGAALGLGAYAILLHLQLRASRSLYAVLGTEEAFRLGWRFFSTQLSGEELSPEVEELLVTKFLARHQSNCRLALTANVFTYQQLTKTLLLRDQELDMEVIQHLNQAARDRWIAMSPKNRLRFGKHFLKYGLEPLKALDPAVQNHTPAPNGV